MTLANPGGHEGGDDWLRQEIDALEVPDLSETAKQYAELSPALGLIYDEYFGLPEVDLKNLMGFQLAVTFAGAEDHFTMWRVTHNVGNSVVVHETERNRHIARWMIGGSVYCPPSPAEALSVEEVNSLGEAPWDQKVTTGIVTGETKLPAMVLPGVLCRDAMLSMKRVYTHNELQAKHLSNALVGTPMQCYAIGLDQGPDKRPTVHYVNTQAQLSMPVTYVGRRNQDSIYPILM